jgi:MerR family copper efflux transcriptional regulator
VSTKYKIKDVVSRTGFTAPTLRYYEEIGLLPRVERTDRGYRIYDDRTLQRLAFIARAKQLGCSLDEIADLATAWDGGRCGPVQDRLRSVVSAKIGGAQQQIVELTALTTELQRAARALEQHRPEGGCDDHCGCVVDADAADGGATIPVQLSAKQAPASSSPDVACTLAAGSMKGRLDEWRALLTSVTSRAALGDGVRVTFGPTTSLSELIRLVVAEQDCCPFFRFAITIDTRGVALEVLAPADALPIVDSLFGTPA